MWYIPVVLRIVVAFGINPTLIKMITGLHSRTKRFALQFMFCLVGATAILLVDRNSVLNWTVLAIAAVGFMNSIGAYCKWRSLDISMSRDSLFTVWDDIIAMLLAYLILKESKIITPWLGFGIFVCLLSVALFILHDFRRKSASEQIHTRLNPMFYVYVMAYSVIWGVAIFLIRYWAISDVSIGSFAFGWYVGAFLGSLVIFVLARVFRNNGVSTDAATTPEVLKSRDIIFLVILSLFMLLSMILQFWALQLAPIIIVFPIFLVSELVIPAVIGLFHFKERRHFTWVDWSYFAIGIVGGVIVGLSRF